MMIFSFLLTAWVLSWFSFDKLFVKALEELFNKEVTVASYYFVFFCIGVIGDIILFFSGDHMRYLFS